MLSVMDEKKALGYVNRYYDLLSKTGYAKHGMTQWYLLYIFMIDFFNWVYPYFTNDDYKDMEKALIKLFSGGNCLVPYPVFSKDKLKIARHVGLAHYTGPSVLRKTQPVGVTRTTEKDVIRRVG